MITSHATTRREKESLKQEDRYISKLNLWLSRFRTATTITSGGKPGGSPETSPEQLKNDGHKELIIGPQRVLPGRLSVSRTFGDLEAKIQALGGNPNVVVAIPEIRSFRIDSHEREDCDFIVMGSKSNYVLNHYRRWNIR